jgi:hypothetical protein
LIPIAHTNQEVPLVVTWRASPGEGYEVLPPAMRSVSLEEANLMDTIHVKPVQSYNDSEDELVTWFVTDSKTIDDGPYKIRTGLPSVPLTDYNRSTAIDIQTAILVPLQDL